MMSQPRKGMMPPSTAELTRPKATDPGGPASFLTAATRLPKRWMILNLPLAFACLALRTLRILLLALVASKPKSLPTRADSRD